jgi:hypothetical protein
LFVVLLAVPAVEASITISSTSIVTPGLPGFRTHTLTATSDGAPIQGFDFVGDPTAPVDPVTSRGIFGPLNQLSPPGGLSTVWTDIDVLLPILIPGSDARQDSKFLFNSQSLLIIPGSARESATSLQAAFSTTTNFGQSVPFAQIVLPVFQSAYGRGVVGTTDGMEFQVVIGNPPTFLPPLVADANLGNRTQDSLISHNFTALGTPPITWDNLMVNGPGAPTIAPTLTTSGVFSWNSAGSPLGLYNFDVTATNPYGSDTGRLMINLVEAPPESLPAVRLVRMLAKS